MKTVDVETYINPCYNSIINLGGNLMLEQEKAIREYLKRKPDHFGSWWTISKIGIREDNLLPEVREIFEKEGFEFLAPPSGKILDMVKH